LPTKYTGWRGSDGARPLGYWLGYAQAIYGDSSPATKDLQAKVEVQGANSPVEQLDAEVELRIHNAHNRLSVS
jgi:hypothetical protein